MDDSLMVERTGGSGDIALDQLLSDLLLLMTEVGDRLITPDDDDPESGLVASNALLHLYDSEGSPLPTHSLRITPTVTDAGNIALSAELTFMPNDAPEDD